MRQDRVGGQLAQPDLCGKWLLKSSTGSVWVTSCLENLEMSENLAPVRKISPGKFFQGKVSLAYFKFAATSVFSTLLWALCDAS